MPKCLWALCKQLLGKLGGGYPCGLGLGSLKLRPVERLADALVAFGVLHGETALAQGLGEVFAPALPAYDDDAAAWRQVAPNGQGEGGFAVVAVLRGVDVGEALLAQGLGGLAANSDVGNGCFGFAEIRFAHFQAAYMGGGDFYGGGADPKQGLGGGDDLGQPEKGFGEGGDADGGKGDGLPACGGAGGDVGGEAVFGADKEDGGHGGLIGIGRLFQAAYRGLFIGL